MHDNQKLGGALGAFIPVAKGGETDIANPFFKNMSASLIASSYHQLFLDQALGSDVGAVVNDAAADLAQDATSPRQAAETIEKAWAQH